MSRDLKIFFATDVHGSDSCFKKFINAGAFYGADILVMGGDLTGKSIVPMIAEKSGRYRLMMHDREIQLASEREAEEAIKTLRSSGKYPYKTTTEEIASVRGDPERETELFLRLKKESLARWIEFAEERLKGSGRKAYIMAGNDDDYALDEVLRTGDQISWVDGHVVEIEDGVFMASTGVSTPTPWHSPREVTDEEYLVLLRDLVAQVPAGRPFILNAHVPPYGTNIDVCPQVDDDLRVVYENGEPVMRPVGSRSVHEIIRANEPVLGLHGHVHEGKGKYQIGPTVGFNPGSDYTQGSLQGVLVLLQPARKRVRDYTFTTG